MQDRGKSEAVDYLIDRLTRNATLIADRMGQLERLRTEVKKVREDIEHMATDMSHFYYTAIRLAHEQDRTWKCPGCSLAIKPMAAGDLRHPSTQHDAECRVADSIWNNSPFSSQHEL